MKVLLSLLSSMLMILIGVSLLKPITQEVAGITGENITSTVAPVVQRNLTPFSNPVWSLVFLAILIIALLVVWYVSRMRKRVEQKQ